jgi:hypothetical protein
MKPHSPTFRVALAAGAAGGVAEMLWVAAYSSVSQSSGLEVAQEVTASLVPDAAHLAFAPVFGVLIHVLLSVVLGVALAKLVLWRISSRYGDGMLLPAALAALAAVWAINFFLILPALNASFVTLMPLAATLTSKLLFGAAMGWTLQGATARHPAQ